MKDPNTPTGGNDKLKSGLVGLTDKKESEISTALQKDKDYSGKEKLIGDTDAILNDLKENHVKTEDAEIMGYKGKKVHIDLPAVGDFKGFKFNYFVSDMRVDEDTFRDDQELVNKSYSVNDISKLLQAMNKYISELQGNSDRDMEYKKELCKRENHEEICNSGKYLKAITGLDDWYWLKDMTGRKNSYFLYFTRNCCNELCYFSDEYNPYYRPYLFLKLSD